MEKESSWKVWLFRWVLISIMAVGGWFAQQVWQGQKDVVLRLNNLDVDRATIVASRFTAMDWVSAKAALDAQITLNERRIFRLEVALENITKSQERIEQRLGTK